MNIRKKDIIKTIYYSIPNHKIIHTLTKMVPFFVFSTTTIPKPIPGGPYLKIIIYIRAKYVINFSQFKTVQ